MRKPVKIQFHVEKSAGLAEVEIHYKSKQKASDRVKITDSKGCEKLFRLAFDADKIEYREEFIILMMNRASHVLGYVKISTGSSTGTVVNKQLIFQAALNANACSIVVAHNHPSGNLNPSAADISVTKELKEAGKLLDIAVLDHLILTEESYYSFADEGMI